jgi:hypothetical protein
MTTLVGDALIAAAFLSYIGFFEEHMRRALLKQWRAFLVDAELRFKADQALVRGLPFPPLCVVADPPLWQVEYLSLPDDRLRWHAAQLPDDELCEENAIMLHRHVAPSHSPSPRERALIGRQVQPVSACGGPVRAGDDVHHAAVCGPQDQEDQLPGRRVHEEPGGRAALRLAGTRAARLG